MRRLSCAALVLLWSCWVPGPPYVNPDGGGGMDATDGPSKDAGPDGMPEDSTCTGIASTCGPSGNADCCASAAVPGGTFYRGYDAATDAHNDTTRPATLSDFRLDVYEVTVGRFRRFVEAGHGTRATPPSAGSGAHGTIAGSGWSETWNERLVADRNALVAAVKCSSATWTDTPGDNESKPINCVTWYEAMAFCIWDGGYLPTETEWHYAASGGSEQRAYPWSSPAGSTSIDCTHANHNPVPACAAAGAARVGSTSPDGDGRWGHADLAGNVWEWTLDWLATYATPCNDCANLAEGSYRVLRGGGYEAIASTLRTSYRSALFTPTARHGHIGVRCARSP
jgi:formylglycine-generating enzyme